MQSVRHQAAGKRVLPINVYIYVINLLLFAASRISGQSSLLLWMIMVPLWDATLYRFSMKLSNSCSYTNLLLYRVHWNKWFDTLFLLIYCETHGQSHRYSYRILLTEILEIHRNRHASTFSLILSKLEV